MVTTSRSGDFGAVRAWLLVQVVAALDGHLQPGVPGVVHVRADDVADVDTRDPDFLAVTGAAARRGAKLA